MRTVGWCLLPAAAVLAGCGTGRPAHPPGPSVECFPVTGQLRVKGQPAAAARLKFYPDPPRPDGRTWEAVTGDDGTFTCSTNVAADGLPPGRYAVGLTWPEELGGEPAVELDRLGRRYLDPRRSRIQFEVKAGENAVGPFNLQ